MHDPGTKRASHTDILKVVLIYALFGSLWILFSDQIVESLFPAPETHMIAQILKGWLFILVTSLLLYFLLRRIEHRQNSRGETAPHGRIVNWKNWQLYLFAAIVTLLTILIREGVAVSFSMRPLLIMFMFPIILSAAIGGFGPGLLSTAIATLYAGFYFTAAAGATRFQLPNDLLPMGFMIINGLLVSFLSKMLLEARHRSELARQQAETNLAEKTHALQLLNGIAEGSTDAIFSKDRQGRYQLFNQAAARNVGKTAEEVIGKDDTAIFKPADAAMVMADDRRVMEANQVITWEHTLATATGTRVFSTTQGPMHDADGEVIGVFGIARDITAIKANEEALRRERDRNQRYLDTVQTIMVALDSEGRITMLNRYGCELLGYRESELLGENWFKTCLPQPEGMDTVYPVFQQIMAGDLESAEHVENAILCRDGTQRTVAWRNGYFRNRAGNIVGSLSSGEDITERRKMEESLRESETTYRSLFKNMLNGFAYCQMLFRDGRPVDFIYLSVNDAFEKQTGLKDVVGQKVSKIIPGIREADPELFEIYGRVAQGGAPEHFETHLHAMDMWFAISVYCPKPEHFVAVFDVITERKKSEITLRDSEARFRALVEQSIAGIYIIQDNRFRYANPGFATIFGYDSPEQMMEQVTVADLIDPQDRNLVQENIRKREAGEIDAIHYTASGLHRNGRKIELDIYGRPYEYEGRPAIIGILLDITARKSAEEQLRKLSLAVEQSPESIVITDIDGNIEYVNEAFVRNTGYSREEVIGQNPRILHSGKTPQATYNRLWKLLAEGKIWEGEFHNKRKDGSEYTEHAIISPIHQPDGRTTHYVAVKEDITEKKLAEAEINRLAFYDTLTGLPNRVLLLERMMQTLATTRRSNHFSALISYNIDRFKTVNDAGGQELGDALLKAVAERLTQSMREGDVVARIAGDEFCILLTDLAAQHQSAAHYALHVADKIHSSLQKPITIGGEQLTLTACLGIALFPEGGADTPLDILRRANTALHHAKTRGSAQTSFFEGALDEAAKQRFDIERELHQAIASGELRVFLQPQVDAVGKTVGAEALVRWQHPQRGLIQPGAFIPIAEESNLIIEIGSWVFAEVCRLLTQEAMSTCSIRISVNISPRHFRQADFVDQIKSGIRHSGVDPTRLTLEVTEGMLIENVNDVIAKMVELSAMGIHFSLDDFGTGYSSLSYLKRLPIHEIKIDKTFVQEMTSDANDASMVETILLVAQHMRLKVVAEGVETEEQAAFLNDRGPVIHQGYLFGRPEPAERLFRRLLAGRASLRP